MIAFLVTLPLTIRGIERMVGRIEPSFRISPRLAVAIAVCAVGYGFLARARFVWPAAKALRSKTDDISAPKWQVGQLVATVSAALVVYLGMLLRLQGDSLHYAALYYVAGFLLLLLWFPRRPG